MLPQSGIQIAPRQPSIGKMMMTLQLADDVIVNFFAIFVFLLSSLATGPRLVSISLRVLEL